MMKSPLSSSQYRCSRGEKQRWWTRSLGDQRISWCGEERKAETAPPTEKKKKDIPPTNQEPDRGVNTTVQYCIQEVSIFGVYSITDSTVPEYVSTTGNHENTNMKKSNESNASNQSTTQSLSINPRDQRNLTVSEGIMNYGLAVIRRF